MSKPIPFEPEQPIKRLDQPGSGKRTNSQPVTTLTGSKTPANTRPANQKGRQ